MPLIEWNESFSVGISEIDSQHKILIGYINDLHAAMSQGKARSLLKPLLAQLANYTEMHFSNEERYMKQWNYLRYVHHKAAHDGFVKKVGEFKTDVEAGQLLTSIEILTFLKNWLIEHIQGTDKKYAPLFIAHGLK